MAEPETNTEQLISQAIQGDHDAMDRLLNACKTRLIRTVDLYLDERLHRVTSVDRIVKATFEQARDSIAEAGALPVEEFYLWVRSIAAQRLTTLQEKHIGENETELRIHLHKVRMPQTTSFALASKLIGKVTEFESEAARVEQKIKLQAVIDSMEAEDREMLGMRHFEQLTIKETAVLLGMSTAEAGKRYLQAVRQLTKLLKDA